MSINISFNLCWDPVHVLSGSVPIHIRMSFSLFWDQLQFLSGSVSNSINFTSNLDQHKSQSILGLAPCFFRISSNLYQHEFKSLLRLVSVPTLIRIYNILSLPVSGFSVSIGPSSNLFCMCFSYVSISTSSNLYQRKFQSLSAWPLISVRISFNDGQDQFKISLNFPMISFDCIP
jgi:hypothetical protein